MAEKVAHLTGIVRARPSIFEIIAHESLACTVEPAFRKVLNFIVSFNDERYGHVLQWLDEGYLIFNLFLQQHYFRNYSASFSEKFYGLKRIALVNDEFTKELSKEQRDISFVVTVLLPYLQRKLSKLYHEHKLNEEKLEENVSHRSPEWIEFCKKCFIRSYNICCILYGSVKLCNYVLYVSGKSAYATPLLRLLSSTLAYAEANRVLSITELVKRSTGESFNVNDGLQVAQSTFTKLLEISVFFLRFLHWWSEENDHTNITALPTPSAPKIPDFAIQFKGICPLCRQVPRIRTVLTISGYIFCYRCILPEIRKNRRCPLTNYPAEEGDMIRLYASE